MANCPPCLRLVAESECPSTEAVGNELPNCNNRALAVGGLCEGDGECGTSRTANNCFTAQDIYARCPSSLPDPPFAPPAMPLRPPAPSRPPQNPQPPFSPLPLCTSTCDAGEACGLCLRTLRGRQCPGPIHADTLPPCDATVAPGDLCEGDGECGTDPTLNNCHGYRDVYRRDACILPATPEMATNSQAVLIAGVAGSASLLLALLLLALVLLCRGWARSRGARAATSTHWMRTKSPAGAMTAMTGASGDGTGRGTGGARMEMAVVRDAL